MTVRFTLRPPRRLRLPERLGVEPVAPEVLIVPRVPRELPRRPRLPAVGREEGYSPVPRLLPRVPREPWAAKPLL